MNKESSNNLIVAIRIKGMLKLNTQFKETLHRLRLRRKYACVLINPTKESLGMINKVKQMIAFGNIDDKTLLELIEKRGQPIDKSVKIDPKAAAEAIKKGENSQDYNLKPFFRLHPPRKGIKSKEPYPKGVLGNHKEKINDLIKRML
ncbi:MAG: uL30 family ribosomal protein [Nanoarchaeota archaeon]|nr:uL30 family ribosomal protein [Nanoarchaeota archaeon]